MLFPLLEDFPPFFQRTVYLPFFLFILYILLHILFHQTDKPLYKIDIFQTPHPHYLL